MRFDNRPLINAMLAAQLIAAMLKPGQALPQGFKKNYTQAPPHQGSKECRRRQKQMGVKVDE